MVYYAKIYCMKKMLTRMEKYKDYREEILKSEEVKPEVKVPEKVFIHKQTIEAKPNKHVLDKKDIQKNSIPKTIFDDYKRKNLIKNFDYGFFVLCVMAVLIIIVLIIGNNYFGFNLW